MAVGDGVAVGIGVGLGVAVAVGVGVAVGLGVGVVVGVTVGVGVAVGLGVAVGVTTGVGVAVGLGVGVPVVVAVGLGVGVAVDVGLGVAVGVGVGRLPFIHLVGDTPPAAAHRTHQVSAVSLSLADRDCAYGKRAWPRAFVFFDIQTEYGPCGTDAVCTDTFCDGTARPRLSLTVQVITD